MAAFQSATQHPRLCFIICASALLLLILFCPQGRDRRQEEERHKRDILDSTEIPAEHIDPAAIDLTPLVNTLINTSQSGSRQLFSLLSVTSYSSLALHKLTLLVYNISSIKSIESNKFRRRFCYCVTNETNDLTDFTAILLDVMGNSTSYLHELFKSSSILSVSQRNNSDCIFICVMAGKTGREVPELWEVDSITPLFNQTIVEGPHRGNVSSIRLPAEWHQLPTNLSHVSPSGMSSMLTSRVHATAHVSPPALDETAAATAKITTAQPTTVTPSRTTAARRETTPMGTTVPIITTANHHPASHHNSHGEGPIHHGNSPIHHGNSPIHHDEGPIHHGNGPIHHDDGPIHHDDGPINHGDHPINHGNGTIHHGNGPIHHGDRPIHHGDRPIHHKHNPTDHSINQTSTHLPAAMTPHTTAIAHTTRLSPARPTAGPTEARRTTGPLSRRTTTPSKPVETEKPGCPWRRPELTDASLSGSTTTVGAHKLQPCVLELCKFFSQCLCRPFSHKTRMKRYCDDSHVWYEKHTSEVCRRVRRVSFSRNLKQRCLTKMCNKL
ncbi:HERV-H LTR-associating protein 1 [Pempheris klunzingeri]|uniref:HERV-H LTR-associating protein 1 n=1 Tax=Pempheris klunzingeri TaxID=3127111 RepID=UPI0039808A1E